MQCVCVCDCEEVSFDLFDDDIIDDEPVGDGFAVPEEPDDDETDEIDDDEPFELDETDDELFDAFPESAAVYAVVLVRDFRLRKRKRA